MTTLSDEKLDLLGGADEPGEPPPSEETEESTEETETKEEEVSEDSEGDEGAGEVKDSEDDEEEEEEDKPAAKSPSVITQIKQKFPNFRKEFPEVIDNHFLAQEFKQTFATPDDAKLAAEKSDLLDTFVNNASDGQVAPFLDFVYDQDPSGLKSLVQNFLPTLSQKSPELFVEVTRPIIDNVFAKIFDRAKKSGDEQTQLAVKYCLRAMGRESLPNFKPLEVSGRNSEDVNEERGNLASQKEDTFYGAVNDIVEPQLDKEINIGLDPDETLPEGLRDSIIEKVKRRVYEKLRDNPEHMRTMAALRRSAAQNKYNREYQKKVARQIMNNAKDLIPGIRGSVKQKMVGSLLKSNDNGKKGPKIPPPDEQDRAAGKGNANPNNSKGPINWNDKNPLRKALDKAIPS